MLAHYISWLCISIKLESPIKWGSKSLRLITTSRALVWLPAMTPMLKLVFVKDDKVNELKVCIPCVFDQCFGYWLISAVFVPAKILHFIILVAVDLWCSFPASCEFKGYVLLSLYWFFCEWNIYVYFQDMSQSVEFNVWTGLPMDQFLAKLTGGEWACLLLLMRNEMVDYFVHRWKQF